jgi:hypothetical protein
MYAYIYICYYYYYYYYYNININKQPQISAQALASLQHPSHDVLGLETIPQMNRPVFHSLQPSQFQHLRWQWEC